MLRFAPALVMAIALLSGRFRKYGDTESCYWWMPGADAGLDVYWTYTRVRGQSQAPPGVPRMSSYLRNRPLSVVPATAGAAPAHNRDHRYFSLGGAAREETPKYSELLP